MTTETKHMPSEREIEAAAAAISREGFPRGRENARGYRLRLARAALTAASQSRAPDQSERVRELEVELSLANDAMQATALRAADEITALRAALAEARKVIEALIGTCGAPQVAIAARDWLTRNPESSNGK